MEWLFVQNNFIDTKVNVEVNSFLKTEVIWPQVDITDNVAKFVQP